MKPEIKKLWVDALRSGQYNQGNGSLAYQHKDAPVKYCCLGVLCDLHSKAVGKPENWITNDAGWKYTTDGWGVPPEEVVKWAGLICSNPAIDGKTEHTASHYNDALQYDFNRIADLIEQNL